MKTFLVVSAALLLAACSPQAPQRFQGYVEGDYLYLAAPVGGYLATPEVRRGTRVNAGETIASLDPGPDASALAESRARGAAAADKLANLQAPRRQPEIAALQARIVAARAAADLAASRLARQEALARQHFVAATALDGFRAERDQRLAELHSLQQDLATYRSSLGRSGELSGADAERQAADAATAQRQWQLDHRTLQAPAAGEINEVYYRPGEWVPAGQPVASLLPDGRRRLRFFVPEPELARIHAGSRVEARCDGCATPILARIDFIAPEAEYTPPVIYSLHARQKLLFRVEARPDDPARAQTLHPGLPVDVTLAADGAHD